MIKLPIILLFIGISFKVFSQEIEVNISNIGSNTGKISISLFADEASFLKKPLFEKFVAIENAKVKLLLKDIKPGTYAIVIYHDENNNGNLDTYFFGLPKEKVAASNNAQGKHGPPNYSEAKFVVKNGLVVQNISFD